jgi:hypothetical protein
MTRIDKDLAIQLRRDGKTYGEIRDIIGPISKSTLGKWFNDIADINEFNLLKGREKSRFIAGRKRTERKITITKEIIQSSKREINSLIVDPLFIIGLSLYWAEGDKNCNERVKFTNADERMIVLMMRWFREVCKVPEERFRIALHIHNLHVSKDVKQYWMNMTQIPGEQFQKVYIKETSLRHRKNILYNGTCAIVVCDKNLFRRISGWKLGLIDHFNRPGSSMDRTRDF